MRIIRQKRVGIFIGIFISIFTFVSLAHATSITDLENKRDTLSRQAERVQQQANQAKKDVASLSDVVEDLSSSISTTQSQINDLQGQITSTQSNITDVSRRISDQQAELDIQVEKQQEAIRTIYETTQQDPIILLGSSNSISSAITQDTYLEALETSIQSSMDQIKSIRDSLNKQKLDLDIKQQSLSSDKKNLVDSQNSLSVQKNQQTNLLNMTASQIDTYNSQLKNLKAEATKLSNQIYAQRLKSAGTGSLSGSGLGYPYSSIDVPDPWGFLTRECTSYVAWYWNNVLGKRFLRGPGPVGTGNATNFPTLARNQGYSVSQTPQVGAIISWSANSIMPYGHVAIVQAINSDGTINVSEYNWVKYSGDVRNHVSPSSYGSYSYIY